MDAHCAPEEASVHLDHHVGSPWVRPVLVQVEAVRPVRLALADLVDALKEGTDQKVLPVVEARVVVAPWARPLGSCQTHPRGSAGSTS